MKALKGYVYLVYLILAGAGPALADALPSIPNRSPSSYYVGAIQPRGLDMYYLSDLEDLTRKNYRMHTEDFIPLNMPEHSSDGRAIAGRVLRQSLLTWIDSARRDQSVVTQTLSTANQQINTNVKLLPWASEDNLTLRFRPLQGLGILRMSGQIRANFYYYAFEQTARLEILENIGDKYYYIDGLQNYLGTTTTVGVRWNY